MDTSIEHSFLFPKRYQIEIAPKGTNDPPLEVSPANTDGFHVIEEVFFSPQDNAKVVLIKKDILNEKLWQLVFYNMDDKKTIVDVSTLERKYFGYKPL